MQARGWQRLAVAVALTVLGHGTVLAQNTVPDTLPKLEEAQAQILQIPFDANNQVQQESAALMTRLAQELANAPLTRVTVRAYTDPEGASAATRTRMALQRALSVRQFLASQGLPAERVNVRGVGRDSHGLGPAERVDIVVTPPVR